MRMAVPDRKQKLPAIILNFRFGRKQKSQYA
jgi:hypothetical protein